VHDARLWHPWLRINRVLRVMLQTRWSAEAWDQVRNEFKRAVALRARSGARGGSTEELQQVQLPPRHRGPARGEGEVKGLIV